MKEAGVLLVAALFVLTSTIIIATPLPPVTVISQDFEAATPRVELFPPPGWSIDQTDPVSTWFKYSSGYARCQESGAVGAQDEWLITSEFNFYEYSDIWIDIGYVYMATPDDDYLEILGSNDAVPTWPNLIDKLDAYGSGARSYDISSWAAGQSQVKIAWHWVSDATPGTDYFYFRSVKIYSPCDGSIFFENYWFDDFIPVDWNGWTDEDVVNMDSNYNSNIWRVAYNTYPSSPTGIDPFGLKMAIYDTGLLFPHGSEARLYSPVMDFDSQQRAEFLLTFQLYCSNYGPSYTDHLDVQVKIDSGAWNTIQTFNTYDATHTGWVPIEVDLSDYYDESIVYIGFKGVDGGYRDICIDNIIIEADCGDPEEMITDLISYIDSMSISFPGDPGYLTQKLYDAMGANYHSARGQINGAFINRVTEYWTNIPPYITLTDYNHLINAANQIIRAYDCLIG